MKRSLETTPRVQASRNFQGKVRAYLDSWKNLYKAFRVWRGTYDAIRNTKQHSAGMPGWLWGLNGI